MQAYSCFLGNCVYEQEATFQDLHVSFYKEMNGMHCLVCGIIRTSHTS